VIARKLYQTGIHGENFPHDTTAPNGLGSPHNRDLKITPKNTTLGRTPLDKWSAWRRDLYATTHTTHDRDSHAPGPRLRPPAPDHRPPQSQQTSGYRPTTGTARPLGSACRKFG